MSIEVRQYSPADYDQVLALYRQSDLFGGQFDENRDSKERLQKRIEADQDAILVAENEGQIVGTISIIEDSRVAWLFRFAVEKITEENEISKQLLEHANTVLKKKGHKQILVYSSLGSDNLDTRYQQLGFIKGGNYTCYWKDI